MPGRRGSGKEREPAGTENMEEIRKSLNFMSAELSKLASQQEKLIGLMEEVKTLKLMVQERDRRISELEKRVDDMEQYSRREEVIITGLKTRHRTYARVTSGGPTTEDAPQDEIQTLEQQRYSVMPRLSDSPLMWMERAATSLFGVKRYGVHVNGYTVSDSGELSMWLARRSRTKQTYPGLLDNLAAGGLAAGIGIKTTLIKECQEEACIPAHIATEARPVSTVSYTYEDEEGVFPESQFVFDLELPVGFKPSIGDGEVQEFYLLPIDKVKELLAGDDFKPNSAMVVLDFLIRHSIIEPDTEPFYQDFLAGLHQTL